MAQLGIGLIGVGKHGVRYARHLAHDVPDVRLVGLARRNIGTLREQAAEFGSRAYGDYRELIAAPSVEALIVVVPPTLHPEILEAAAAAHKPVLLEKPAAATVAAGRRMLHAAHEAGIAVMVAQTLRYNGVVRRLLDARGQIGRIHSLRLGQRFEPSRPGWIDDPSIAGGGMTLHTGVHCFDLLRILTGLEADRVSCEIARIRTTRTEDNFAAVIRLGGGTALATVTGSRATASRSGGIEVVGEHGQLIGDHVLNTAQLVQGTTVTKLELPPPVQTVREVITDFVAAVRRGGSMPIPLAEGIRAVAIAEACYQSADNERAVPVPAVQ